MPNYIEFDKSQSNLYPAASNAGVTVLGISASNELFLKDSNGSITVIGNQAPLESILQTDNVANTNIVMRGASLVLDTVNSSLITYENSITNNTLTVSTETLTDSHNLKFPDGTGTLILTVNGQSPDASGNVNVATGSFTGSFSGSFYGQVIGSLTGTSSFASNAATASYIPLVAGPGINISGLNISASVRTVNAVLPVNGNIALSLSATKTGTSASLTTEPTASLADGTVWIVSGDANPNNNGDAYIFNSGSQLWYPIAPLDQAAADARYLLLNSTGSMLAPYALTSALGSYVQNSATSSFVVVSSFNAYTSSVVTTSSFNAFTSSALLTAFFSSWTGSFGSQFAGSASYASSSTLAVTASYATTASYALNVPSINTGSFTTTSSFNQYTSSAGSQFAGTASFVAGTIFTGANLAATSSLAVSASYVRILQGTNITVNYSADGIQISSSASGPGGGGSGVDNIGVANSTQIQLKSGSFFVGDAITVPFATSATSASYILGSNVVGAVASASFASTASLAPNYVLNSSTSSMLAPYVLSSATSSFVTNSQTSSMSVATASFVTASNVVGTVTSASYALTASFALNATQTTPSFIATGSVTASVSPNQSIFTLTSGSTTILRVTGSALSFPNGSTMIQMPDATVFSDNSNPFRLNSTWGGNYAMINASKDATFGTQVNNLSLSSYYATLTLGVTGSIIAYSAWDINPNVFTIQKAYAGPNRNLSGANETLLNINNKGNGFGTFGGISRGVYVDLLITASGFNDYRAIETTVGNVTLNTVSGSTLIGTATGSGHKLYVLGSGPSGSLNVDNALLISGSSSTISGSLNIKAVRPVDIELNDSLNSNLKVRFGATEFLFVGHNSMYGGVGGSRSFTIPNTNNFLIGTTTDSGFKLDVSGSGRFSSNVTITGSLTVSGSSTFTNIGPAIFSGSVTIASGSILQGTASFAQALTNTSYLINTGSTNAVQTITGSLTVTQNLTVLGSASIAYLTASQTLVNQNTITVFGNGVGLPNAGFIAADTASIYPSSSIIYNIVNQKWSVDKPFSGSLEGTFTGTAVGYLPLSATSSMLSPYALTTALSSYVLNSATSSMIAGTASFVTASSVRGPHGTGSVLTSSFAITASYALNAGNIDTGSLVTTASFNQYTSSVSSQFAGTASFASTASFIVNTQFLPIVIEAKIDSNAIPLTSSFTPNISSSIFGLRSGSAVVTSSNFVNRQVEVFRNGAMLPGINLGDGSDYITKTFGSNTITFANALTTDEYIKIKCL